MKKIIVILFLVQSTWSIAQSLHTRHKDLPCINKHYNIFAHAIYDSLRTTYSEESLNGAIAFANEMFSPICISFSLCEMDTVFNYNYNTLTKSDFDDVSTLYTGQNRINVFLLSDTLKNEFTSGLCLGSVNSVFNANIYLKKIGSLTHELGHFFGLGHTFGGDELVDGSNCLTEADKICDTPADPYQFPSLLSNYIRGCTFIYKGKDSNGDYYQPDVGNVMSYYGCNCGFTWGQYSKMAENYRINAQKHW